MVAVTTTKPPSYTCLINYSNSQAKENILLRQPYLYKSNESRDDRILGTCTLDKIVTIFPLDTIVSCPRLCPHLLEPQL